MCDMKSENVKHIIVSELLNIKSHTVKTWKQHLAVEIAHLAVEILNGRGKT